MLRMAERSDSGMYSCRAVVHGYEVVQSNIAIVLVQGEYCRLLIKGPSYIEMESRLFKLILTLIL